MRDYDTGIYSLKNGNNICDKGLNGVNIFFVRVHDACICSFIEAYNMYDKGLNGVICLLIILSLIFANDQQYVS